MTFRALDDLGRAQRDRARATYDDAFPDDLRQDFDELARDDTALGHLDADGTLLGLVVLREMRPPGWAFLRYFAVAERGRGAGSRMWRDLFAERPSLQRLVLDVEDPLEPGLDDEERTERERRVVFYERLGVVVLPVEEYHPPHDGGVSVPMRLLVGDREGAPAAEELRDIVIATYGDRYGLPETDPHVQLTLSASGL